MAKLQSPIARFQCETEIREIGQAAQIYCFTLAYKYIGEGEGGC